MNKWKAIICSALLMIVIFVLLFATIFFRDDDMSLYYVVTSFISGMWIANKVNDFYNWLRKDAE